MAVAETGDVETLFAQALARPAARASAFDPAELQALFGEAAALTFTASSLDSASGAQRLEGVTLKLLGEEESTLFTADTALVWNLDTQALAARLRGERLDETLRIFDRIELSGLSFDLTDYSSAVNAAVNTALDDPQAAMTETSAMQVGTLALGGLTLHPWTHEAVEGQDAGVAAMRIISAFARSFSLDTMLFQDVVTTQTVGDTLASGSVVSKYPRQLVYGYDRGRIGGAIQTGVTFDGTFDGSVSETGETLPAGLVMSGSSGFGSWTGADFSKLLEWGEKGEMPPFSERDLWNLGSYILEDTSISLSGKPVIEIGKMEFSAQKFSWFLPEEIRISHEDVALDLGAFMDFAASIDPEAAEKSTEGPSLMEIAAMLDKVGLNRLSGDGVFTLRWNPETGATQVENSGTADGLFGGTSRMDLTLPSYTQIAPLFGDDGKTLDTRGVDDLLEDHLIVRQASMRLTDLGGLDTLARLAIEISKSGAVDNPMAANFAEATPETVRMFASGLVVLGSGSMTKDFPQATAWAGKLSQFLTSGGTFEITSTPKPDLFDQARLSAGGMSEETPGALADLLGVTVTHTPAPAENGAGTR